MDRDTHEGIRSDPLGSDRLAEANARALANRPFLDPGFDPRTFRRGSPGGRGFRALRSRHPYFGYVDVEIEGAPPFVMFSNNDDRVAQTYFWYGPDAFESMSLRIWSALALRSNYIFDVGAFTGVYTLIAAHANPDAHLYCFEPIKRTFNRLMDNLRVNGQARRVGAFNVALGDTDGQTNMNLFGSHADLQTGPSLLSKRKEAVSREHVETMRLDTFVREHNVDGVDLMKIDVEEAERMVLDGMPDVLGKHHPDMIVEVIPEAGSDDSLREVAGMLSPHGYNFAVIDDKAYQVRINDFGAKREDYNVLFSTRPVAELKTFCGNLGSPPRDGGQGHPGSAQKYLAREQAAPDRQLRRENERLRRQRDRLKQQNAQCWRQMEAMQGSRGWKVARGINLAIERARSALRRG